MKKLLLLTVLLVSSVSWAANFSVGGGLNLALATGSGTSLGGHVNLNVNDLVALGPASIDLRTGVNFSLGTSLIYRVEVAPLASLNLGASTIYAGPVLAFGSLGTEFGVLGGARFPLALGLYAYAEGTYFLGGSGLNLRGGVSYSFSF
jgi:hypothetical protein